MKASVITLTLSVLLLKSFAQDSITGRFPASERSSRVNELGLEIGPFIKYYINFSNSSGGYSTPYMLTYRHYFKNGNLRAGIGGNSYYNEFSSPYNGDSLNKKFYTRRYNASLRIGYEFVQELSRRWQVYYGADLTANYAHERSDSPSWNAGYASGYESTSKSLGMAPVLGIRFRINQRLSLITESSFLVYYSQSTSYRYYLPISHAYPDKKSEPKSTQKAIGTSFSNPLSLILTITI